MLALMETRFRTESYDICPEGAVLPNSDSSVPLPAFVRVTRSVRNPRWFRV